MEQESFIAKLLANPILVTMLTSWAVRALGMVGVLMVGKGWLTPEQAAGIDWKEVVGGLLMLLSFWYGSKRVVTTQRQVTTSLANPDITTQKQLEQVIKDGGASAGATPKDVTPTSLVK